MIYRSHFNDKSINILIKLLEKNRIKFESFERFLISGIRGNISEEKYINLMSLLLDKFPIDGSLLVITSICFHYKVYELEKGETLPEDLLKKTLMMPAFWENAEKCYSRGTSFHNSVPEYWKRTIVKFLETYPKYVKEFAEKIVEFIETEENERNFDTLFRQYDSLRQVLTSLAEKAPDGVWGVIEEHFLLMKDLNKSRISILLSGRYDEKVLFNNIDPIKIWKWIDENKQVRAPYLAKLIPAKLLDLENNPLTKSFLVKYADQEKVRKNFSSNFYNSRDVIIGSWINRFKSEKQFLEVYKSKETNKNIRDWISDYFSNYLDKEIRWSEQEEERENFL